LSVKKEKHVEDYETAAPGMVTDFFRRHARIQLTHVTVIDHFVSRSRQDSRYLRVSRVSII
jgi:hypothetical protein